MNTQTIIFARFFGVVARSQTYLNLLYLFLAFPLGLFYFIFLVVGLALGFSLLIIWIGLFILVAVFAGWWAFAAFERQIAIWLLHEDIPSMVQRPAGPGLWAQVVAYLSNPVTWKGLLYLFAKFPLGIFSFVVSVTLIATSLAFLASPLVFPFAPVQVWLVDEAVWRVDTLWEALILFVAGLFLVFISLHLLNGLAWLSGRFARIMLGNFQAGTGKAVASGPDLQAAAPILAPVSAEPEIRPVSVGETPEPHKSPASPVMEKVE